MTGAPSHTCDPERLELEPRLLRQVLGVGREDARARLDEDDARRPRVDPAEVAREGVARDLGERPRHLDPGRPAADHDERQPLPAAPRDRPRARPARRRAGRGGGSRARPPASSGRARGASHSSFPKYEWRGPGRHDQVVVRHLAVREEDALRRGIDRRRLRQQHPGVRLAAQDAPDRRGDLGGRQRRPSPPGRAAAGRGGGSSGRGASRPPARARAPAPRRGRRTPRRRSPRAPTSLYRRVRVDPAPGAQKTSSAGPIRISSPSVSGTSPSTRRPPTSVPFLLPRSRSVTPSPVTTMRACWRDTRPEGMVKTHSGSRPTRFSPTASGTIRSPHSSAQPVSGPPRPAPSRHRRRRPDGPHEGVAEALDRAHEARLAGAIVQGPSDLADDPGKARLPHEGVRPEPVAQLGFRERAGPRAEEDGQELEGLRRERHGPAAGRELAARLVEGEPAEADAHPRPPPFNECAAIPQDFVPPRAEVGEQRYQRVPPGQAASERSGRCAESSGGRAPGGPS